MMASGPFALGPAAAGTSSSSRRFAPAAAPIPIPTKSGPSSLGIGLSQTAAPKIKTEERKTKVDEDEEVYSDPDEGVEIIDMEKVHKMDWMAPESIGKERLAKKPKKEDPDVGAAGEINLANALNLSESEDEEELETIIDDFAKLNNDTDMNIDDDAHRLYFFQFPSPFPSFTTNPSAIVQKDASSTPAAKKVSFATDVKSEVEVQASSSQGTSTAAETKEEVDGMIGHLEIYRSGAVKMRLANGILLDVNAGTQASFLQQAVHLDLNENRLAVLGEITKHFIVTPDVDVLLNAMDAAESSNPGPAVEGEENMIRMDVES
ncbi:hypothetical protein BT96DRAFT_874956 [Gymnopus androsaceus JB14]|uniref:RNA polymerase III RPC4-domain-containing protein n=1 Tax=Gymnopus androsaceus JB14 TaxID=1447944 RepID=A0A6A4IDV7_9AGAR|nr:hypothetical protein BT96DRAFT_874956 [Gymnopus androsaceus JB14]